MNNDILAFLHAGHYSNGQDVPAHKHTGTEIIYIIQGGCTIELADKSFELHEGELCVTAPGEVHSQRNNKLIDNYYLVFNADPDFFDNSSRVINIDEDKEIILWLRQLVELNDNMFFQQCTGLSYAILSRITMLESRLHHKLSTNYQLNQAIKYIEKHISNPQLSLELIAKHSGISVSYLKKLFKSKFQISPMKFVQKQRMRKALQMLRNQYLFINEICEKCGYPNPNYFSRVFKKVYNKTPSEFREILNSSRHDISRADT